VVLDPANLAYRTNHALHLGYDGRREEAVAALLEVTAKPEGQTAEAWMALGGIYRSFEPARVAEAVAAYEKALKLDPKNGQAAMGVARSYRAGRQWARAVAAYERVSGAFPRLDREALLGTAWCYLLSGDDTRARFYTGLAARAGADVEPLRRALSREGAAVDDFERAELGEGLRSKNAGDQARAVKGLLELGRPAVPSLAAALGRAGTSLAARELIVDGLSRLGPAAREALPQLDRLAAAAPPPPGPQESDEEKALREREARLTDSARAASEKIRARRVEAP
jgi:tetratricopeptide (TPR) repeat protein